MNTLVSLIEPADGGTTIDIGARPGDTSALVKLLGSNPQIWAPGGVSPFPLIRVAAGAPLFHDGAPTRHIYLVQAGYFKTVLTGEDGYEQVLDFAGRDDLLGCDGLAGGQHAHGAVALQASWAYALPVADILDLCHRMPEFAARWQSAMATQIARAGDVAWVMAAVGAEKRTARFVLSYSRRMAARGQSPRRLLLNMCRRDIASHLGLAHESVSRAFSMLSETGYLHVDNREVEILDLAALHDFAQSTRGYPDGPARRRGAARQAGQARGGHSTPADRVGVAAH